MNSDNLKNSLNEREILPADEQQISRLIGGLEKVSAPDDFAFRVKARIAAAKEDQVKPTIWRTLRYVLPLTATVIVAAFVLIQAGLFLSNDEQNIIVEKPKTETPIVTDNFVPRNQIAQISNSSPEVNQPEEKTPESSVVEPKPDNEMTAKNPVNEQKETKPKSTQRDESGNSRTLAQRPGNINISPEKLSGNTAIGNKDFQQNNSVSVLEILEMIGVETENAGNKISVKSVKEKSTAERSGVKKGDIIEAIDGQKLEQGNLPPNFKGGNTITVSRGNKTLKIQLKPN